MDFKVFYILFNLRYFNQSENIIFSPLINFMTWVFFKSSKSGAQTQIRLAVDPELEKVTGKYFSDCLEKECGEVAKDEETAEWLWKKSEELTGVKY